MSGSELGTPPQTHAQTEGHHPQPRSDGGTAEKVAEPGTPPLTNRPQPRSDRHEAVTGTEPGMPPLTNPQMQHHTQLRLDGREAFITKKATTNNQSSYDFKCKLPWA